MRLRLAYGRSGRLHRIEGQALRENTAMLSMCRELGFRVESHPQELGVRIMKLRLH
jgi:acetyltransferase